jgi:hypothetical protein
MPQHGTNHARNLAPRTYTNKPCVRPPGDSGRDASYTALKKGTAMKLQPLIVAAAACLASLCSAAATDQKAPPAGPSGRRISLPYLRYVEDV